MEEFPGDKHRYAVQRMASDHEASLVSRDTLAIADFDSLLATQQAVNEEIAIRLLVQVDETEAYEQERSQSQSASGRAT